jgi:hypothetical protein
MKLHRLAGVWLLCLLTAGRTSVLAAAGQAVPVDAASADSAPLFRVFLKDGGSLVSYGELARVDDRVVFSMPTSASAAAPQLQLINIPSDRVDWERTINYAEAVRAKRYLATRGETDYAQLTNEIEQALNDVGLTDDPARRLAIVERARKTLADWPASHYNYRRDDVQQLLGALDEAIASLRAATGASTFDLTFVAAAAAPPTLESIMPAPGAREAIELTLRAAQLTTSPAERVSLLTVAVSALDSEAASLPADWAATTRSDVLAQIAREVETDRKYQALSARVLRLATARARMADVRGVQAVLASISASDRLLGSSRPDAVASMVAAVDEQLEQARRLRLERDRWALRAPELRAYRTAMSVSLVALQQMIPLLEDIKALAGSGPAAISAILRSVTQTQKSLAGITPPSELRDVHNLFVSAVQLADSAAKIRREAAIGGSMSRAWDASSAAAGALMLAARARNELQFALRPPQAPR